MMVTLFMTPNVNLFREFLIFETKRELLGYVIKPGNYFVYSTLGYKRFSIRPARLSQLPSSSFLFWMQAEDGDELQLNSRKVFFSVDTHMDDQAWCVAETIDNVLYSEQGQEFEIYKKLSNIVIAENDITTLSKYALIINEDRFNIISSYSYSIKDDQTIFNISEAIKENIPTIIKLINVTTGKLMLERHFIVLKDFECEFGTEINGEFVPTPYFFNNDIGLVKININGEQYEDIFYCNEEILNIKYNSGDLQIAIPSIKWRIDNGEWQIGENNSLLWYKQIHNNAELEVVLPNDLKCQISINNDYLAAVPNKNNIYKFGERLYFEKDEGKDEAAICLHINGKLIACLMHVAFKECFFLDPLLTIEKGELKWDPTSYIGDVSDSFTLELEIKGVVKKIIRLNNQSITMKIDNLEENIYEARLWLKKGFVDKTRCLWGKHSFVVGNYNELKYKNKMLKIDSIMLDGGREYLNIKPLYARSIKYWGEFLGIDYYSAIIYAKNCFGKWIKLDFMPNNSGTPDIINPVRIEFKSSKSLWMVVNFYGPEANDFDGEIFYDSERNMVNNDYRKIISKSIDYYCCSIEEDRDV